MQPPSRSGIVFTLWLALTLALSFIPRVPSGQAASSPRVSAQPTHLYLPLVQRHFSFLESSGLLDSFFDEDGKLVTNFGIGFDSIYGLALQPDNKILAAGWAFNGIDGDFGLVRYLRDGRLDLTFSTDGMLTTDISGEGDGAYALALQPDGKIILAGQALVGSYADFALVRYHPDGSLDQTFSTDGMLATDFKGGDDVAYALALQPDGKILVAGQAWNGLNQDFALARYNFDGSLDTSFSFDGKLTTDFAGKDDYGYALALQPDGKILVAGQALGLSLFADFALARYNPDGSPDTSFDLDGKLTTDFGNAEIAYALALQPDGKIVAAGRKDVGIENDFVIVRYTPSGSLDTSFSSDGKQTTDFDGGADIAYALALQPDGKIILAGQAVIGGQLPDFALARYNPNGSLDPGFDMDGLLTTDFGYVDAAVALLLLPNGRILAGGLMDTSSDSCFAIARYK